MNPVMSRIDEKVQKTPAGYPSMPGYQPGRGTQMGGSYPQAPTPGQSYQDPHYSSRNTYSQQSPYPQQSAPDMSDIEQAYAGRDADAVDRGQVTMDDIVVRTGMLFGMAVVAAAVAWIMTNANPALGALMSFGGALVALILVFINVFKKQPSPVLISGYAIAEGLFLGGISAVFNAAIQGIVAQAIVATFIVFAVTLVLYSMRVIRNTPTLQRFTLIGLISVLLFLLASYLMGAFGGVQIMSVTLFGLPVGLIVGLICIVLGVTSLIGDFDVCERAIAAGAPKKYAWMCGFGIMVTLVYLYVNFLRVLAYISELQR